MDRNLDFVVGGKGTMNEARDEVALSMEFGSRQGAMWGWDWSNVNFPSGR